jgi:hypothetical protein
MQTAIHNIYAAQRSNRDQPWQMALRAGAFAAALGMLGLCAGCITAPPKKQSAVEKAREETVIGAELEHQFRAQLKTRTDPVVEKYLDGLAALLAEPMGDPRLTGVNVAVIQDRGGQWRTYSLPGRRVYFSLGLLQRLTFDNEVAAVIALEYGHLIQSHALNHLKKQRNQSHSSQQVDFFSPEGIFSFDAEEIKLSIKSGIEVLYKAGFDIRGMLQIWSVLAANPSHSPLPPNVLSELSDYTRTVISRYAPLRNPIVSTEDFQSVHKRIMKL